jgi:beta-glucosidase
VELPNRGAFPLLVDLVRSGEVEEAAIDRAVHRGLRAKFLAGLFEHPYADADYAEAVTNNAEARALALETARKAITLLKNDGDLLPLDATQLRRVAVIGPNAAETVLGGYSDVPTHTISILDGIRARVGDAVTIDYAEGARITEARNWWADEVVLADPEENRRRIELAVAVARGADVAVVVVGDNEQTSREAWAESHLGDRTSLDLVGEQDALVRAVVETGVPTVVVLINGRPLSVNYIAAHVPAVLEGWYLGQETGTAVAGVLFGDVNPGGKLPVTIPRSAGQLPLFYNHKPSARRGYLFDTTEPLYPFGHGLSYTTFTFNNLRLSRPQIAVGEPVDVTVDVVNTGAREGDEVVQLYIRDVVSSVTRPVKALKGFERITLAPGERRTVRFTLTAEHLEFYNRAMERVVEPGRFDIMVGPSSAMLETISLDVVAIR